MTTLTRDKTLKKKQFFLRILYHKNVPFLHACKKLLAHNHSQRFSIPHKLESIDKDSEHVREKAGNNTCKKINSNSYHDKNKSI